jgi:hypothetical protein
LCGLRVVGGFGKEGREVVLARVLVGFATGEVAEAVMGVSSRSSIEKSRSCVDSGGRLSAGQRETDCAGCGSADSSRAICVPLSRKSSQPSIMDGIKAAGRGQSGSAFFDAGSPGSLNAGFLFICDLAVCIGGLGFLGKLEDRT